MNMKILYNNKEIINGEFISPQNSQFKPKIDYQADVNNLYTLIMHDPDAPAGNHLHWVVINIPGNDINKGTTLLEYTGPAPPKGSGTHKYIFLLIEQREKKFFNTLERVMSMDNLYNKLNLTGSTELGRTYFTSSNQLAGKKRKRSKTKSRSKKARSRRLKKRN
jgi:phosphatidylethanolamine-binding protein (PEBP) family uncharacterized protein